MIFLPSKYRPYGVQRFIDAYLATGAVHPVVIATDNDSPERMAQYRAIQLPPTFSLLFMAPAPVAHDMNALIQMFPDEEVYGTVSDDCVPRTPHWDARLIEAAMQHGVAWINDGMTTPDHDKRWGDLFIRGDLLRAVGYYAPPGIDHLYFDQVWMDIADRLGIGRYLEEVILEHLHWSVGKAAYDESYHAHAAHAQADQAAYEVWKAAPGTEAMIQRIRAERINHA